MPFCASRRKLFTLVGWSGAVRGFANAGTLISSVSVEGNAP
jgi:hypothetical protein